MSDNELGFCNLHQHTVASHLDAICDIDQLFQQAKELGQRAIAVTDHGSMGGIYKAYKAYKSTGVQLIPGNEIYFTPDLKAPNKDPVTKEKNPEARRYHLVLLAMNEQGYKNLLRITYEGFKNSVTVMNKEFPRVDAALLEKYNEGLFALSACGGNIIAQSILNKNHGQAIRYAQMLKDIYGDRFFIELQPHGIKRGEFSQITLNSKMKEIAEELGVKMVATCDAHYIKQSDEKYHDMVLAISDKKALEDLTRHTYTIDILCEHCTGGWIDKKNKVKCTSPDCVKGVVAKNTCPEFYLKNESEIMGFFTHHFSESFARELIGNVSSIVDACEKPDYIEPDGIEHIPFFGEDHISQCPDYNEFKEWREKGNGKGLADDIAYLRFSVWKGFTEYASKKNLSAEDKKKYWERAKFEISVLESRNFSSYMLIVADYIRWSRDNGVLVGPGRGCLTGDTEVLTTSGFKPLKKVCEGDTVFSHTGERREVTASLKYDVSDEELLEITTDCGWGNITLTKDHKVFGFSREESSTYKRRAENKNNPLTKIKRWNEPGEPSFIPAQELKVGDVLFTPFPKREVMDLNNIDLNDYERYIPFDEDFAYFLGRWIGDGWICSDRQRYSVGLAFNSNDIKSIERFKKYFSDLGLHVSESKHNCKDLVQLVVNNKLLCSFIRESFPDYECRADTKYIGKFKYLKEDLLRSLLCGYEDAAGHVSNECESIDTVSERLAFETKECLLYLGIPSSISTRKDKDNPTRLDSFKIKFTGLNKERVSGNIKFTDTGYYTPIRAINSKRERFVYDITVEGDHSYLTSNFAVHNSAGGSLVAFFIGIHRVDPIQYGLFFERFHNLQKKSLPDIDTDFAPSGRERVFNYCKEKYGHENVAYISNLNKFTPKVVLTDVIRSLKEGGDTSTAFKIAKGITAEIPDDVHEGNKIIKINTMARAIKYSKGTLLKDLLERNPDILDYANAIVGLPRNYSTHAGGVIISDKPLPDFVPIRRDKKGAFSIQYEKGPTEDCGLVKMDFLGLTTLDIISEVLEQAKRIGINLPDLDTLCMDETDHAEAYKVLASGLTTGCFQIEGHTLQKLCKPMQAKTIEDIALINALGRPSCSDEERTSFIARRNGKESAKYPHPLLEDILKETHGISIYEEDLLHLAPKIAGWDLSESDGLRKITKLKEKGAALADELEQKFVKDAIKKSGISQKDAQLIWDDVILPYSKYGFTRSHAIAYSMMGYATAYYKIKARAPFFAAVLNSKLRSKSKAPGAEDGLMRLKNDAKKYKVKIATCDINKSLQHYVATDETHIVTGLGAVKGLGDSALDKIIENQPYSSLQDFIVKNVSKVNKNHVHALAKAGAFDELGVSRKYIFEHFMSIRDAWQKYLRKADISMFIGGDRKKPLLDQLEVGFTYPNSESDQVEWSLQEKLEYEKEVLGEYVSGTPKDLYPDFFKGGVHNTEFKAINYKNKGDRLLFEGIITGVKEFTIKRGSNAGKHMGQLTVINLKGETTNIVVWNELWEKHNLGVHCSDVPVQGEVYVNQDSTTKEKGWALSKIKLRSKKVSK